MFLVSLVIVLVVGDFASTFFYHVPQHLWFKLHLRTHHDRSRSYWDHAVISKDPEIMLDGLLGALPYIAIATCLAAGLWGIENDVSPPPAASGDASGKESGFAPLPRTLREANALLAASTRAREILGEGFVDHYVRTRDWEVRQFERAVTDWEMKRYFETV